MTNLELVAKVKHIANNVKTLYVMGCFGAPLTEANKKRYIAHNAYNAKPARVAMINAATADTYGFDCVNLIKGCLWGWNQNPNDIYGGAKYCTNGVPDIGANAMITYCKGVTTDFRNIEVGEAVWLSGHIGVYIGDGLAVECSPKWKNCVQITAVGNIGTKAGYNTRTWTKHGKLPWVEYTSTPKKTVDEIAREVYMGLWGVQPERQKKLEAAGYNYSDVMKKVNEIIAEEKKKRKGDVNGDGKVTSEDSRLAMRAAVGLEKLTDEQKEAADMDEDGKITAADARAILRKSVGLDE